MDLADARGRCRGTTTRCGAGRSRTSSASGARCGGASTFRPTATRRRSCARARDAGRDVVSGRRSVLRRARLPRAGPGRDRHPVRVGDEAARRVGPGAQLREADRPRRGPDCARLGVQRGGPRGGVPAQTRRRTVAAFLATTSLGGDLVRGCSPDFGRADGDRPLSRRSSRRCCSPSTPTAMAAKDFDPLRACCASWGSGCRHSST